MRKSSKRRLTSREADKLKDIENLLPKLQKEKKRQNKKQNNQQNKHGIKVEPIKVAKVEPVKHVDVVADYIVKIEEIMKKYDQDCQKLGEKLSYYDKLISEHYHKIETSNFNASEGYRLSKQLQELLQKRRVLKDEMYRVRLLKRSISGTLGSTKANLDECKQKQNEYQKNWKHTYTLEDVL